MDKQIIYLAIPYSHPDPAVREARFMMANMAAARLIERGEYVFSPISQMHPIALVGNLPLGWEYWQGYDREVLEACGKLIVIMAEGWRDSTGVAGEMDIAMEYGISIEYMDPLTFCITSAAPIGDAHAHDAT